MESFRSSVSGRQYAVKRSNRGEIGFYIACDDRSILNCVNTMLLNQGVVGLSDGDGKVHYLIDGRRGEAYAVGRVKDTVLTLAESRKDPKLDEVYVYMAIDTVIEKNGFVPTLLGTQILRFLLYELYKDPGKLKGVMKELYPLAMPVFHVTPGQVERNLRYAIRKRKKDGEVTRIVTLLRLLLDESLEEILHVYGRA